MSVVNAFKCGLLVAVSTPVNEMNEAWGLDCVLAVNAPVYIRIEMRTVNKCMIGTKYF